MPQQVLGQWEYLFCLGGVDVSVTNIYMIHSRYITCSENGRSCHPIFQVLCTHIFAVIFINQVPRGCDCFSFYIYFTIQSVSIEIESHSSLHDICVGIPHSPSIYFMFSCFSSVFLPSIKVYITLIINQSIHAPSTQQQAWNWNKWYFLIIQFQVSLFGKLLQKNIFTRISK